MFEAEAEAEAKILALRSLWPRGLNITEAYTFQQHSERTRDNVQLPCRPIHRLQMILYTSEALTDDLPNFMNVDHAGNY